MSKIIETALPLKAIRKADIGEKVGSNGHPGNMHIWWGRTPISSTAVILKSAMLDVDSSQEATLAERLEKDAIDQNVMVFDPFAGFGGIPLACQQIGLRCESSDLNPVAVMLNKAATEIPARFSGCHPVHEDAVGEAYAGVEGLAEDVKLYGKWLFNKAWQQLKTHYPQHEGKDVQAWLWTRTVKCPNPACGCDIPLSNSYVISSRTGREAWVEPLVKEGKLGFSVHAGACPPDKVTNKFGNNGARFRCISCGEITSDDYVKKMGQAHQIGSQLMAVMTAENGSKQFWEPDANEIEAAIVPTPESVPPGSIPDNAHIFRPPSFGYGEFADLFTPRQLTMLMTFSDLLRAVQDKAASDALAAGYSHSGGTLGNGGRGALAYGEAVSVYLALLVDMLAEYNSFTCAWDNRSCTPRSAFRMQTIPMQLSFGEGNPFTEITGSFTSLLRKVVDTVAGFPCKSESTVSQKNAVTEDFPENVLVCTELPYDKAAGYAHLSDYFYIWLRRSLQHIYPDLFKQTVTPKEELSTVAELYGADANDTQQKYTSELGRVCSKLYAAATEKYPALIFFEYHIDDDKAIRHGEKSSWEVIISSLLSAGFTISNILPLWGKKGTSDAKVLIVCRKSHELTAKSTRRAFVSTFKRDYCERLDELLKDADAKDHRILAMGCGLSIYSNYKAIINADGTNMSVHDALQIIMQEMDEYFALTASSASNDENAAMEG